jgi:hypothetical protein
MALRGKADSFVAYWQAVLPLVRVPFLAQHNCASIIEDNNVERVLADIDANYGNRTT